MKKRNNLKNYLAVTAGTCCATSVAHGAVVIYGPGAQNTSTTPATPAGFDIGLLGSTASLTRFNVDFAASDLVFNYSGPDGYFSAGTDLPSGVGNGVGYYANSYGFTYGATAGDQNYINLSFDGDNEPNTDTVFEAVGQFFFDGAGGGYLVAIASNDDGSALSISDGAAMIDAVPEPSSLALLALGSAGLLARRQRKQVA